MDVSAAHMHMHIERVLICTPTTSPLVQVASKSNDLFHFGLVDAMDPMIDTDGSEVPLASYFNISSVPAMIYFQVCSRTKTRSSRCCHGIGACIGVPQLLLLGSGACTVSPHLSGMCPANGVDAVCVCVLVHGQRPLAVADWVQVTVSSAHAPPWVCKAPFFVGCLSCVGEGSGGKGCVLGGGGDGADASTRDMLVSSASLSLP